MILTQPMGYVKTKNKALPLMRKVYRDYPALLDTPGPAAGRVQRDHGSHPGEGAPGRGVCHPPGGPLDIKRVDHNRARIQAVYDLGRAVAEKAPGSHADIFRGEREPTMTERETQLQGLATEWRTMAYTWRDCALYALAVGATGEEPQYTYEKDMQVIPTFGGVAPTGGGERHPRSFPRPRAVPVLVEESAPSRRSPM